MATKFQKRHYKAIADVIRHLKPLTGTAENKTLNRLMRALGIMFKADNKNFNQTKFYAACTPKPIDTKS